MTSKNKIIIFVLVNIAQLKTAEFFIAGIENQSSKNIHIEDINEQTLATINAKSGSAQDIKIPSKKFKAGEEERYTKKFPSLRLVKGELASIQHEEAIAHFMADDKKLFLLKISKTVESGLTKESSLVEKAFIKAQLWDTQNKGSKNLIIDIYLPINPWEVQDKYYVMLGFTQDAQGRIVLGEPAFSLT